MITENEPLDDILNAPISADELNKALHKTKNSKASGLDGSEPSGSSNAADLDSDPKLKKYKKMLMMHIPKVIRKKIVKQTLPRSFTSSHPSHA